jgi:hypothetical protein
MSRTLAVLIALLLAAIVVFLITLGGRDELHRWALPRQPQTQLAGGSATDAVADVGGLGRVDHANDLQLDLRR